MLPEIDTLKAANSYRMVRKEIDAIYLLDPPFDDSLIYVDGDEDPIVNHRAWVKYSGAMDQTSQKLLRMPSGMTSPAFGKHTDNWADTLVKLSRFATEYSQLLEDGIAVGNRRKSFLEGDFIGEWLGTNKIAKSAEKQILRKSDSLRKQCDKLYEQIHVLWNKLDAFGQELDPDYTRRHHMHLQTCIGQPAPISTIIGPTEKNFEGQLRILPGGDQISCVHLWRSRHESLMIAGSCTEKFWSRRSEHNDQLKYECPDKEISLSKVIRLMTAYAEEEANWDVLLEWTPIDA